MINPHNLYIHVPFCISKCKYCAFYSAATVPNWEQYCSDICSEIDFWKQELGKISIPTIFFGGGTPSLMPQEILEKILVHISNSFNVLPDCEITIEANPGTIDFTKLSDFISLGMNRISIGIQSLDDKELDFLGRKHDSATALKLLDNALSKNIKVNADFIYGLPNQMPQNIQKLCHNINSLGIKHVSMYELTIEPNTPFGKMNLNMPNNFIMAEMYSTISNYLQLPRYEVSNYATIGNECKHNQNIWDGDAYIGLGRGAAGRIYKNNFWYEQLGAHQKYEKIFDEVRATEKIITGLRTIRGVKLTPDIKKQLNINFINEHSDLITINSERLCATEKGMLILDNLLLNLVK